MKKSHVGIIIIALIVIVAAVAGLSSSHSGKSSKTSSASSSSAVSSNTVTIQNYMFGPMAVKVKVGTKVTWTNKDAVNHTITADNPSNDAPNSMDIAMGKSYSFTFTKAGSYTYHCFPHPYMHGTIEVTN